MPVTPDASWSVVGSGDFDGDGKTDILWRNTSGQLGVWLMNGAAITGGGDLTSDGAVVRPDASWSVAGIGDFDGTGTADILWRNTSGALIEWQMNGSMITSNSGNVTSGGASIAPAASWHVAEIGDFDGDGQSDILWRNDSGAMAEWDGRHQNSLVGHPVSGAGFVVAGAGQADEFRLTRKVDRRASSGRSRCR
jgi:hypothetical protein